MARRSVVATVSILVHAIVLVALATMDLRRPISEWPRPRELWAFTEPHAILIDVQLPPEPRRAAASPTTAPTGPVRPSEQAPIAPPTGVAPEGDHQDVRALSVGDPGPIDALLVGNGEAVTPPPPQIVAPPQPKTPLRPHSGIKPPLRLVNVAPIYPATALAVHQQGVVIIDATIDEHGNVSDTRILRSIPLLDNAAVAAVRQWKFSPTLLNGMPVPVVMTVTVNFTLTQ